MFPRPPTRERRRTRRRFLAETATTVAGTLAGALLFPARDFADAETSPHIDFPTAARERIAIASYSFREFITPTESGELSTPVNSGAAQSSTTRPSTMRQPGTQPATTQPAKMTLQDFAAHVMDKFKIDKIEPWSPHFVSREPQYLAELRTAFDAVHVSVVNIAVDGEHSIYAVNPSEREKAIADSKSWIDVAAAIGSPSVRTRVAGAKDSGPDLQRAVESLRHVAEYGESKNIIVNLENDNFVSEDAFFIGRLVATVNSPWVRSLPDFANSLVAMDARQAYDALDGMFAEAYNICHVKAVEENEIGTKFHVDMSKSFAILKHHNFKGFCSLEFASPGDPYGGTADLIKQTLQHLS
jgi:sugar phosphate isomerase/epimerase